MLSFLTHNICFLSYNYCEYYCIPPTTQQDTQLLSYNAYEYICIWDTQNGFSYATVSVSHLDYLHLKG